MLTNPEDTSLITKLLDAKIVKCPHCAADNLQKWGTSDNRQRYRCKSCKRTFNGLTGTELNGMHYQDKWDACIETMLQGTFLRKTAAKCGIALSTSFNWRHKFLKLTDNLNDSRLEGIVQIDEKVKVVVAKDRSSHIFEKVMKKFTLDELKPTLLPRLASDIVLCSDGHMNYYWLSRKENIKYVELNASANERVKDKVFHIQNVNNYHGKLKSWIQRFKGVASKNLHKYVGWMRWFEQNEQSRRTIEQFSYDMMIKASTSTNFRN